MTDDFEYELVRLDKKIAEDDARTGPDAEWRAADAVYRKADLIEHQVGGDAALPLYEDVVRRLERRQDPGPRALLIGAQNSIAVLHDRAYRDRECRVAAKAIVEQHFVNCPPDAAEHLAMAAIFRARHLHEDGDTRSAAELLEQLIGRYGQPGAEGHVGIVAAASCWLGLFSRGRGDLIEALRRYDTAIEAIGKPSDEQLRRLLARALVGKAYVRQLQGMPGARDELCRRVLDQFARDEHPETVEHVAWARANLGPFTSRLRSRPRRR